MYDNDSDDTGGADPLAQLSPEELRQLLGLGVMPEKQDMLRQQLLQAQALRNSGGERHTSPTGAALGALAQGINGAVGGFQEGDINRQLQELLGQQVDARQLLLQKLLGRGQGAAAPPMGAGDVMPPGGFGLG